MNVQVLPGIFQATDRIEQCSTQRNEARMPKYQALFSFISPESHLSHILAGFFVTNQPGEIKTRQTNQETKEN